MITTPSIWMVGISAFDADCIAVTVPPSTAVLIKRAETAATILAWVEVVFMIGPLFGSFAMKRTVGTSPFSSERLAMKCRKRGVSCKRRLGAVWGVSAVHSGFLTFRRRGRHLSLNLAE